MVGSILLVFLGSDQVHYAEPVLQVERGEGLAEVRKGQEIEGQDRPDSRRLHAGIFSFFHAGPNLHKGTKATGMYTKIEILTGNIFLRDLE